MHEQEKVITKKQMLNSESKNWVIFANNIENNTEKQCILKIIKPKNLRLR